MQGRQAVAGVVLVSLSMWGCAFRSTATDWHGLKGLDGQPTYLFFVLVAPESSTGAHLKALARISRIFKDPGFRARLLEAPDAEGMYRVIAEEDAKY